MTERIPVARKRINIWFVIPIVAVVALIVWQRVGWINVANAPIDLLEGVKVLEFEYDPNRKHLEPDYTQLYRNRATNITEAMRHKLTNEQSARLKQQGFVIPLGKDANGNDLFGKEGEEIPDQAYLSNIDETIRSSTQAAIQNAGFQAVSSPSADANMPMLPRAEARMDLTPPQDKDVRVYNNYENRLGDHFAVVTMKVSVKKRFEHGRCLFYVRTALASGFVVDGNKDDPSSADLVESVQGIYAVPRADAQTRIGDSVYAAVTDTLRKAKAFRN